MFFIPKEYIKVVHFLKNCQFTESSETEKLKIYHYDNSVYIIEGKTTGIYKNDKFLITDTNLFNITEKPIGTLIKATLNYENNNKIVIGESGHSIASPSFYIVLYQVKIKEELKGVGIECPRELETFFRECILSHFKVFHFDRGFSGIEILVNILIKNKILN